MLEFFVKGGVVMWPILMCSILALAIFLERLIRFSRMRTRGAGLAEKVIRLLRTGDIGAAEEKAVNSNSSMGRVLAQAIRFKDRDRETLETVIMHATEAEIRNMSSYLQALATIGNLAPLLGLLGTVTGMIKAFMVIQQMGGKVNAAVLAGGIWEAMLTTAFGLIVALPIVLAHSYLLARVDKYETRLNDGAVKFITELDHHRS
ncbi:MAG: MotA/TolQ/ExbB proton channel family protein [Desulfobacteraceae bacterium]|nr:MotA/TolQ/ExbB proton channel family protein [Desulfobacteraceae bacterium]